MSVSVDQASVRSAENKAPADDSGAPNGASSHNDDNERGVDAHMGVRAIEVSHKIYGKYSKWVLFCSLGLAAYIYSLDGSTTYTYLSFAASEFDDHSLISTIQVAQSIIGQEAPILSSLTRLTAILGIIIVAVGKPVVAKIADVTTRGIAYIFVLGFYVVGYVIIASSKNIQSVAGGIILYAVGYTGLQLLTQVIIADITTLKWRGFVSSMISLPFIINAFVGANISAHVITGAGWRWGYGMFAILMPVSILPLIITLLWAENKARKLGIMWRKVDDEDEEEKPFLRKFLLGASRLDLPGLVLIGASVALILLPLTLANLAKNHWDNPSMIAMIVIGCILLPVFALYDFKIAMYPVIPLRFVKNPSVAIAGLIGTLDFVSFYISFVYLYSFVFVVKPWSLVNLTYFSLTQTVALTIFSIMAGIAMFYTRRYKYILIVGLGIRLLGAGLMIRSRGANGSDVEIVWSQILQGIGGGFAAVTSQIGAQAAVPHSDVAMVIAAVLLVTEIGGAIGSGVAGAIWTNLMPGRLAVHLPFISEDERAKLFGSITLARQYDLGTPIREGVIAAYSDVMKVMTIVATIVAVFPFALSFLMPDWYLGDTQNAVEGIDLSGERLPDNPDEP